MATTWDQWIPNILPWVPGCSIPLMEQEIVHVARDLFRRTKLWQAWSPVITTVLNQPNYTLPVTPNSDVLQIKAAICNDVPIEVVNWKCLPTPPEMWNPPTGVYTTDRLSFTVVGSVGDIYDQTTSGSVGVTIAAGLPLQLLLVYMPSLAATGIDDDEMASLVWDALASGTRARLMSLPKYDFTDLQLAGIEQGKYEAQVGALQARSFMANSATMPRSRVKWY